MDFLKVFKENKASFCLSVASAVLGIVAVILYGTTGIIKGFTENLSAPVFIFAILGIIVACLNAVKRVDTLETFAFTFIVIALVCFFVNNANYLVAVVRGIDVTHVSGTFVTTVVFFVLSLGTALASICFNKKAK